MPNIFLLLLLLPILQAALTHDGLPNGQTIAITGADFLHPLAPVVRQRPVRSKGPHPNRRRKFRKRSQTISELSPFHTLHDSACAPKSTHRLQNVIHPSGFGVSRMVTSSQLSKLFARAGAPVMGGVESVIVLFHGGSSCEWSVAMWDVWLQVVRRYRGLCLVAINAREDSMLNYNLMVLGFPTIMRIRADRSAETFRGNRTAEDLIAWVYRVTGVPPMQDLGEAWMGEPEGVLDVREDGQEGINWALVGANAVSALSVLWWGFRAIQALGGIKDRGEGEIVAVG